MQPTQRVSRSRRTVLTALGSGLAVGVAGCLGGEDLPEPVSLDDGQACDECGMEIEQHPGPTGQVFFDDHPADEDRPAWFCSGTCTFSYRFDREDEGLDPIVTYLTDYSAVDYSVEGDGEDPAITAHLSAGDHRDAAGLSVVVGSDVEGAMGPELIPFSDSEEAEAFADEYGGDVRTTGDVDRELVDSIRS